MGEDEPLARDDYRGIEKRAGRAAPQSNAPTRKI
jgi:hypothetical protein